MIEWLKRSRDSIIRTLFLIPIILVAIISISHVISWYSMTNPMKWAIFLSIAVEVAAMVSLAAASVRVKGGVWFVFGIVTFIQFVGNIFYSYKEIDEASQAFLQWIELTSPIFELAGTEATDIISHKRWLALLTGGLLPIISLTSLHFFIKFDGTDDVLDVPDSSSEEEEEFDEYFDEDHALDMVMNGMVDDMSDEEIEELVEEVEEILPPEGDEIDPQLNVTISGDTETITPIEDKTRLDRRPHRQPKRSLIFKRK